MARLRHLSRFVDVGAKRLAPLRDLSRQAFVTLSADLQHLLMQLRLMNLVDHEPQRKARLNVWSRRYQVRVEELVKLAHLIAVHHGRDGIRCLTQARYRQHANCLHFAVRRCIDSVYADGGRLHFIKQNSWIALLLHL